jgi:hypothetical protein
LDVSNTYEITCVGGTVQVFDRKFSIGRQGEFFGPWGVDLPVISRKLEELDEDKWDANTSAELRKRGYDDLFPTPAQMDESGNIL